MKNKNQGKQMDNTMPENAQRAADEEGTRAESQSTFPIVGIGASAGGLAAFETFFSSMPSGVQPGMAFVIVQHLAPDHKSMLADIIQGYTGMKACEAEDGMEVTPGCVYIIPPNWNMAISDARLHLIPPEKPRGQRLPIDYFLRSLAEDMRERAVGIVLSGTGSDGSQGARAIKGAGGLVIVQDPLTTEHSGMPRSAMDTGVVDYVLPIEEMPKKLIDYAAHAFGKYRKTEPVPPLKDEGALRRICVILRTQAGNDFSQYKTTTIYRRIERRMAINQIARIEDYVKCLQQSKAEVDALYFDLLIGVTQFFRDTDAFKVLEETGIPMLFADKPAGSALRVWVPCCSTGEEAYSITNGMAQLHSASVTAHSEGMGKGSEFRILFPIEQAQINDITTEAEERAQALRVLLIDDNQDFCKAFRTILEVYGNDVHIAYRGEEGIEMAKKLVPQAIFCDIGLPNMDGYEVARRIRSHERLKDIFLVAVTGYAGKRESDLAHQAGFDMHIAKPIGLSSLKSILNGRAKHPLHTSTEHEAVLPY